MKACRALVCIFDLTAERGARLPESSIIPEDAGCKSCGYSLRGMAARRCPECGREFDPNNLSTMHLGQQNQ
jgi:predicted Zn-ribbon and HTH transcriptional regulator